MFESLTLLSGESLYWPFKSEKKFHVFSSFFAEVLKFRKFCENE